MVEPGWSVTLPPSLRPAPEGPDDVMVYLWSWVLGDWGSSSRIPPLELDPGCRLWESMTSPPVHTPPNLRGIPADHHGVGNPRWFWPRRPLHPPESAGEGVPWSGQALWMERQESDKVWKVRRGRWDESCIEGVVWVETWPGWSASGWRRANISGSELLTG